MITHAGVTISGGSRPSVLGGGGGGGGGRGGGPHPLKKINLKTSHLH